jgi:hypothetical protein
MSRLIDMYINVESARAVNLPFDITDQLRQMRHNLHSALLDIESCLRPPTPADEYDFGVAVQLLLELEELISSSKDHIFTLMERDSFPRFLKAIGAEEGVADWMLMDNSLAH